MTKTAAANAERSKGGVGLRWGVETQGGERRRRLCEDVKEDEEVDKEEKEKMEKEEQEEGKEED